MDKSLFDMLNGRMPKPTQGKAEKKPSLAMRYAMSIVEINQDGDIVPDSPFSFLNDVRESMGGVIGKRLEYINLANADASMEAQMECYKHYVVTLFSPFHDHLTMLVLADYSVRTKVYRLIFDELTEGAAFHGFGGMRQYLDGPLFNSFLLALQPLRMGVDYTPYYNIGRKLREIAPLPRFDHVSDGGYFEFRVAKDRGNYNKLVGDMEKAGDNV